MQLEGMEHILHAFLLLYSSRQPALPLRQGEYPQGEGVDTMFTFA